MYIYWISTFQRTSLLNERRLHRREFSNVTPHEERKRERYQYIYIVRFS